jgi:PAS domain S-box-containing protein
MILGKLRTLLLGSLRRQLITGVAVFQAVLMTVLIVDLTTRQREMLLDQQVGHAMALAQSIATSSAGWVVARDVTGLQEIIQAQERYPELRFAMAADRRGAVLAHTDGQYRGKYVTDLPRHPELTILSRSPTLIDVASPVMVAGRHVGWVRIGVGQTAASAQLAKLTRSGGLYALAAILIGGLLAGLMATRLTRRLHAIQSVADSVRAGEPSRRARVDGTDEAARLARQFNGMLDTLAQREREVLVSRDALRDSEARFQRALRGANDGLWEWDMGTGEVFYSPRWKAMLGYRDDELEPFRTTWERLVHPDDGKRALAMIQDYVDGRRENYEIELRMAHKDGHWVHILSRAHLERDQAGRPLRLAGTHVDITERKMQEALLRQDREQQTTLRGMLELVVKGGPLEETLDQCLARLLAVTWLSLEPRGGVFLMAEDRQALRLVVSRDLSQEIRTLCARVPLGACHCGAAAASREMQFSRCVDERHEIRFSTMADHGHYNLPLISEEELLGVMVLYLPHGFERDPVKEQFLTTVADILAGFIRRKHAEDALERSEQRYRTLLESAPDAIYIDQAGIFTYLNPAAVRLFGAGDASELTGRPVLDRIHTPGHARVPQPMRILSRAAGAVPAAEETFIRMDGSLVDVEVTAAPCSDDLESGMQVIVRDITERKKAEEALRRLNEELEDRVGRRTAELVAAKEEAERASRAKSEFLSRMSHELRTPLNAILGFGQLLELDVREAEQADNVGEILRAGRHLLELINEVLDLARIEAGKLSISPEPVPLAPLIEDCLALIRPMAEGRGIRMVEAGGECVVHVRADRVRLKQALLNLLSNAVKYNREGGLVSIACVVEGDTAQIRISDTGAGLSAEQQARLFVAFERLDADKSAVEGTGIGLALSKRLVELMEGRIGVESAPGRGSTFWVRLPVLEGHGEGGQTAGWRSAGQAVREAGKGRRDVLCIEDNPANLRLVERILSRRADLRLLTASQPGLGLELARAHRPELILLDINLQDMDGYDVLKCLRESAATRDIPVVAISANAMPKDLARGRAAGFRDYLTKPLDVDRLLAVVDGIMGGDGVRPGD